MAPVRATKSDTTLIKIYYLFLDRTPVVIIFSSGWYVGNDNSDNDKPDDP